jgi:hypothetical protein
MEIETVDNKTSEIKINKFLNNPVFPDDLQKLIKKMKDTSGWRNGELVATILLKSTGKQIVLTVLHNDTEIKSYLSGDSVTFQMIEGKMKFHSHEETIMLENGQNMTLYNKIKFSLTTHEEESAFLLTINTGKSEPVGN